jgi:hypothetical protein
LPGFSLATSNALSSLVPRGSTMSGSLSCIPPRIHVRHRIPPHVRIHVRAIAEPDRVRAHPPAEPGGVVAGAVVGEARLLVALFAGVAVTLGAHVGGALRAEGGGAVGWYSS